MTAGTSLVTLERDAWWTLSFYNSCIVSFRTKSNKVRFIITAIKISIAPSGIKGLVLLLLCIGILYSYMPEAFTFTVLNSLVLHIGLRTIPDIEYVSRTSIKISSIMGCVSSWCWDTRWNTIRISTSWKASVQPLKNLNNLSNGKGFICNITLSWVEFAYRPFFFHPRFSKRDVRIWSFESLIAFVLHVPFQGSPKLL